MGKKLQRKTRVAIAFALVLVTTIVTSLIRIDGHRVIETMAGKWIIAIFWIVYMVYGYWLFHNKK